MSNIINDKSLIKYAQIMRDSFIRKHNLLDYLIFINDNVFLEDLVSYFGLMDIILIFLLDKSWLKEYQSLIIMCRNLSWIDLEMVYDKLTLLNIKDYIIVAVNDFFLELPSRIVVNHCFREHNALR